MQAASNQALVGLAVVAEQDASASLLRGGVRLLREQRFAVTDLEPVLALLAPGLERLSKLVLGTVLYEKTRHWPTERGWRTGWGDQVRKGHEVEALVRKVRDTIDERHEHGGAPGWVRELAGRVDLCSDVTDPLLKTIDRWADAPGRYANFNALSRGGAPSDEASPHQLWTDLTAEIAIANPQRFQTLDGSPADWDAAMSDLHALLAESVVAWVDLVVTAWNVGRFGEYAKRLPISDVTWPRPK